MIYSRIRPSGGMDFKFDCSSCPPDHFKDALRVLTRNLFFKINLPNWATKLTERIRRVNLEFNELKVPFPVQVSIMSSSLTQQTAIYGRNGHACRSAVMKDDRRDLFSGLLNAVNNDRDI